jgi:hypothetical protein
MRSRAEIEEIQFQADELVEQGRTKVPGMSYEEGVTAALQWALGDSDENPMDD